MKKQRKLAICNPHVLADVTQLVEFVLRSGDPRSDVPFHLMDVEDLFYHEDQHGIRYTENELGRLQNKRDSALKKAEERLANNPKSSKRLDHYIQCKKRSEEMDTICFEKKKVKSWWIVSRQLARCLKNLREPMLESCGLYFWGCSKTDGIRCANKLLWRK
jgi:hypothetical protein